MTSQISWPQTWLLVGVTVLYFLSAASARESNMRVDYGPWQSTPLDDYVRAPDPHYSFSFLKTISGPGFTLHILNMTSQKWLTEEVTVKPIWWHYLTIIIPDVINYNDTGFVWIDQGSNTDGIPSLEDPFVELVTAISVGSKTVGATVKQIPNQPTVFLKDPERKERKEDAIIAWTWKQFINNSSFPDILLRLPMTKAVVRAMDTVTTYVKKVKNYNIGKFMVAGASKRGWTTWTTAAVDKRVIAMAPVVMDLLNFQKSLHHHYRALGGWTFAFKDYYALNFTEDLDNPNITRMRAIIDPLTYNDRYSMPKLIVSASGDEFFMLDDSHYYYDVLQGPKFLKITPNAEHSLIGHEMDVMFALRSFYLSVLTSAPFPAFNWTRTQTTTGGKITVYTSQEPTAVSVYYATTLSDGRRDFRLLVKGPDGNAFPHPVLWFKDKARRVSAHVYEAEVERPQDGWRAFFVQLNYPGRAGTSLELTTETCVVPDTFVFPDCRGLACRGSLV
ncbi:autocrine proliferation repressor protein A [Aplysia californica]|uniref:Autocrine proliferation repressor protein A n=1 Tax=Aplysia californica TaxID=6500 RepID=A0ABM0JVZ5_APLCA|nr:autocrine proliferation repressor protein A [Aplysia californica]